MTINDIKIEKMTEEKLNELGVASWPIWEKEVSDFDWTYAQTEQCYILEGQVEISGEGGSVSFGPGDFVTFPKGLECTWHIKEVVKKHYRFI